MLQCKKFKINQLGYLFSHESLRNKIMQNMVIILMTSSLKFGGEILHEEVTQMHF